MRGRSMSAHRSVHVGEAADVEVTRLNRGKESSGKWVSPRGAWEGSQLGCLGTLDRARRDAGEVVGPGDPADSSVSL